MASFQAKIGWKRPRKRKNKNCLSIPFLTRQVIENSKKKRKKIKKSKNTIVASFQTKIGWKRPRNGEKKNCSSVSFPLDA